MSNQVVSVPRNHPERGAVELVGVNINAIIALNEFAFVLHYCGNSTSKYTNLIIENFDVAADALKKKIPRSKKILVAKVDGNNEKNGSWHKNYLCGPQLIIFKNGLKYWHQYHYPIMKNSELIASMTMEEYLFKQLQDPIKPVRNSKELENFDRAKHLIIGYFDREGMPEYEIFCKVAHNLREKCQFAVRYGYFFNDETSKNNKRPSNQPTIVFTPDIIRPWNKRETYKTCIKKYDELNLWAHKKCMVREMTLENYTELTDEGLPFVVLLYNPSNYTYIKDFQELVGKKLIDLRYTVNFVTVDGLKFHEYLRNIGKSKKDLPIIERDGFEFLNFNDIYIPGKLKEFVSNYSSNWKIMHSYKHSSILEFMRKMVVKKSPPSSES